MNSKRSDPNLVSGAGEGSTVGVHPLCDEDVVARGDSVGDGEGHARGVAADDCQLHGGLAVRRFQPQAVDLRLVGIGEGKAVGESVLAGVQFIEDLLA